MSVNCCEHASKRQSWLQRRGRGSWLTCPGPRCPTPNLYPTRAQLGTNFCLTVCGGLKGSGTWPTHNSGSWYQKAGSIRQACDAISIVSPSERCVVSLSKRNHSVAWQVVTFADRKHAAWYVHILSDMHHVVAWQAVTLPNLNHVVARYAVHFVWHA